MTPANPWDERYAQASFVFGTEPNDFLAENARHIKPGGRVICLGEGEGRNAVWLARQGFDVTGVDQSSVGLAKARSLAQESGVSITTVVADLSTYDLGTDKWDAIVSIFCHLPPSIRTHVHEQIGRALTPGGVLLLEAYTARQCALKTGGPPTDDLMMSASILREDLPSLEFVVLHELDRMIHEGAAHEGLSAVVQCVARKNA